MGRELLVVGPEATEVDDLAHPGVGGRAAERPRRGGIALLEVSTVEGVHEVVGEVDALERRRQGVGVVDIRSHGGAGSVVRLGAAGERPDLESCVEESRNEPAADEPGGAGDEDAGGRHVTRRTPRRAIDTRHLLRLAMFARRVSSMPAS